MSARKRTPTTKPAAISERFIRAVCERLGDNKRVRRNLPIWGRLHIDRQLPFLCVYRRPPGNSDAGTPRLVTSEASYLIASGSSQLRPSLRSLIESVAEKMVAEFGAFLILELWSGQSEGEEKLIASSQAKPSFRIIAPPGEAVGSFVHILENSLKNVRIARQTAEVEIVRSSKWCTKLTPLIPAAHASRAHCSVLGLEVKPIYRCPRGGDIYPVVLRDLRRGLTRSLRQCFYEFARSQTADRPKHFHVLGRRAVVKAVWEVDARIAEVSDAFDFLLQVTPVNAEEAWREFARNRFERRPVFYYRPIPVEPAILKRRLYAAPIESTEDPALADLFRQKQDELDRKITMLTDINTRRFVYGSQQVFGRVQDNLRNTAKRLLEMIPPRAREDGRRGYLDAKRFAERAQSELAYYQQLDASVNGRAEIREDIVSGSMVSHGALLIGRRTRVPVSRAEALIQHEIGTHVVTYYNGRSQPLRQLYSGLAGYEALQEGLAVLSEYLVGGLSRPRLRLLAARVRAVDNMVNGASFIDTFRDLVGRWGFARRMAFTITMRVYRGGGLTKDAVYLRGLIELLDYLKEKGDLDVLFSGKFAVAHVPIIKELQWRKVLHSGPLRPRYLDLPETRNRLERTRRGLSVTQLVAGDVS